MTQSDRPTDAKTPCIINDRKLDYLFNVNIKPNTHNSKRALQNRQQLNRLGFDDDSESRQFLQNHLEKTVQEASNIVKQFVDNFINNTTGEEGEVDTEIRDSLLPGRTGKFAQVQSSWEVMPDGTRRFLSAIIYGK
ncbi:MAG: hypothetical protein HC849_01720 [Oscillatoriales cyanobacterium RU_3_3]|nr:hypothetical protein [Oscillatoriales cyanobacterium RU_3_3]